MLCGVDSEALRKHPWQSVWYLHQASGPWRVLFDHLGVFHITPQKPWVDLYVSTFLCRGNTYMHRRPTKNHCRKVQSYSYDLNVHSYRTQQNHTSKLCREGKIYKEHLATPMKYYPSHSRTHTGKTTYVQ